MLKSTCHSIKKIRVNKNSVFFLQRSCCAFEMQIESSISQHDSNYSMRPEQISHLIYNAKEFPLFFTQTNTENKTFNKVKLLYICNVLVSMSTNAKYTELA